MEHRAQAAASDHRPQGAQPRAVGDVRGQEMAVATAVAAEPVESVPRLEDEPSGRDDDQEESGPRIVAFVPPKAQSDFKHEDKVIVSEPPPPMPATPPPSERSAASPAVSGVAAIDAHEAHGLDHDFFADGEKADKEHREAAHRPTSHFPEAHEEDPKASQKMTPAVRERRARFTKYVKWAVGASAVVCLAALVRVAVARGQHEAEPAPVAVAAPVQPTPGLAATGAGGAATAPALLPAPAPPPAPSADLLPGADTAAAAAPSGQAADPAASAASAGAPAPEGTAPAASAPPAASDAPSDPAAAKEEKKAAQKALEKGDLKGAIEAGERAVVYDPTDGDAWLLLGAAYQEKGKAIEARRAFTSCLKEAKRGAIGECRAMLR